MSIKPTGPELSMPNVVVLTAISRLLKVRKEKNLIQISLLLFTVFVYCCYLLLFQLPMDEFFATAIKNITLKSNAPESINYQQQHPEDFLEFDELLPLLRSITDALFAVTVARWLVENLQGEQNKSRALETALAMAQEAKEQAASQVYEN